MAGKAVSVLQGDTVALGDNIAVLTRDQLLSMAPQDKNKAGIVLGNYSQTFAIVDAEHNVIDYKVTLYIQRSPISDEEKAAVKAIADDRTASAAAKKLAEEQKLAREKAGMFKMGQDSTLDILERQAVIAAQAQALLTRK
jgi:multidrug efflux pump subunit AcrA (membrane-fusion protein)